MILGICLGVLGAVLLVVLLHPFESFRKSRHRRLPLN